MGFKTVVWLTKMGLLGTFRPHFGEVAEWSKAPDSKPGVAVRLPRVRIPPSPPCQNRPVRVGFFVGFIVSYADWWLAWYHFSMTSQKTNVGFSHKPTKDILEILKLHPDVFEIWNGLTPLARNEWICWVTIVKQEKTRQEHLKRMCEDLRKGKRRPCCWPGCPHRRPSAQKWFS